MQPLWTRIFARVSLSAQIDSISSVGSSSVNIKSQSTSASFASRPLTSLASNAFAPLDVPAFLSARSFSRFRHSRFMCPRLPQ